MASDEGYGRHVDKRLAWIGIAVALGSFALMVVGLAQRNWTEVIIGAAAIVALRIAVPRRRRGPDGT